MIVDLTVKFAKENPTWGYDRISGALSNVGYHICDSTIGNILKAHGIEPAPTRRRTGSWETFLKSHWHVMAAIDFTTVKVWTKGGLTTFYLLFVMELKTRRVDFAGCTTNPNEEWIKTVARELTKFELMCFLKWLNQAKLSKKVCRRRLPSSSDLDVHPLN